MVASYLNEANKLHLCIVNWIIINVHIMLVSWRVNILLKMIISEDNVYIKVKQHNNG